MLSGTPRPTWITFDCYGTLIQWDEGLRAAAASILADRFSASAAERFIVAYDRHEHALEQAPPHRRFRDIAAEALGLALSDLGLRCEAGDATVLTDAIGRMPPFPEAVDVLAALKRAGLRLCIVSNTDEDLVRGSLAQLGGHVDRVVTAEQAGAYKPARRIFEVAHAAIGVGRDGVVHVCASPHLDLVATRDLGLRDVWIDRGTGRRIPEGCRPDAVLPSLHGLPELFGRAGWM